MARKQSGMACTTLCPQASLEDEEREAAERNPTYLGLRFFFIFLALSTSFTTPLVHLFFYGPVRMEVLRMFIRSSLLTKLLGEGSNRVAPHSDAMVRVIFRDLVRCTYFLTLTPIFVFIRYPTTKR
jgi:hypothetical protein